MSRRRCYRSGILNLNLNSKSNSNLLTVAAIAGSSKGVGDHAPYLTNRAGLTKKGMGRSVDGLNLNGKIKDFGPVIKQEFY